MPVYRRANRTIHHIHIPKCGGSSIGDLLEKNGWDKVRKTIPRHLEHEILGVNPTHHEHRNVWASWEISSEFQFAVIRNPYDRFDSKMRQSWAEENALREEPIKASKDQILVIHPDVVSAIFADMGIQGVGLLDNHYRPQVDFIGPETEVYTIEDDIPGLLQDLIDKEIVEKSSVFPRVNSKSHLPVKILWDHPAFHDLHKQFKYLYGQDFHLFDYETRE
jgi:hypothetical protein